MDDVNRLVIAVVSEVISTVDARKFETITDL